MLKTAYYNFTLTISAVCIKCPGELLLKCAVIKKRHAMWNTVSHNALCSASIHTLNNSKHDCEHLSLIISSNCHKFN